MSQERNNNRMSTILKICLIAIFMFAGTNDAFSQKSKKGKEEQTTEARVTGLRYICIHVLELEKTLNLYREILGFKLDNAEVLHGGLEGMLVLKLRANDLVISLSVPSPESMGTYKKIGNTNHNHFMLRVNDIGPIGDKLKAAGYKLENDNYTKDKYTFFEGPNGEIVGLSSWN